MWYRICSICSPLHPSQVCLPSFSNMLCAQEADLYALLSGFCLGLASEKHQQPMGGWKEGEMGVFISLAPSLLRTISSSYIFLSKHTAPAGPLLFQL